MIIVGLLLASYGVAEEGGETQKEQLGFTLYTFRIIDLSDIHEIDPITGGNFAAVEIRSRAMKAFISRGGNPTDSLNVKLWKTIYKTYYDPFYIALGAGTKETATKGYMEGSVSIGYNFTNDHKYLFGVSNINSYGSDEIFSSSFGFFGPFYKAGDGSFLSYYFDITITKQKSEKRSIFGGLGLGWNF